MSEEQKKEEAVHRTADYTQPDASTLSIRLDPTAVLTKTEELIRGGYWQYEEQDGQYIRTFVRDCIVEYKLSEAAIRSILRMLNMAINPHTIQANIDEQSYDRLMKEINISLADRFMSHVVEWGVSGKDADSLIDDLMFMVSLILTRPKEDLERKHNNEGIKTFERLGSSDNRIKTGNKTVFGG